MTDSHERPMTTTAEYPPKMALPFLGHLRRDRVFKDLMGDFTKSDLKSFWDNFEILKITLKCGNLI
jgi:hypothetical protein